MDEAYSSLKNAALTPSRSISSPFMDAFRTAHASATREFDQFYGYISKVMTPRRSQLQSNGNIIHKSLPQTAKRLGRYSNKNTLLSTPNIDRRPHSTAPYPDDRYIESTTHYYPPHRPMTLSPNTSRTNPELDNNHSALSLPDEQQQNDKQMATTVYTHATTPHRSTIHNSEVHDNSQSFHTNTTFSRIMSSTPMRKPTLDYSSSSSDISSSLCPSSPSIILQDRLQVESRRLEQLRHDVLIVQQQSLALSYFGASSTSHKRLFVKNYSNDRLTGNTSDCRQQQRQSSFTTGHQYGYTHSPRRHRCRLSPSTRIVSDNAQPTTSLLPPVLDFTTSTPLGSPSTHNTSNPFFSAPSSQHRLPSTPRIPNTNKTSVPSVNSSSNTTPSSQQHIHQHYPQETADDIPKTPLQPYKTISTSTRSRINDNNNNNKLWAEMGRLENEASPSPPPKPSPVFPPPQTKDSGTDWNDAADNDKHQWDTTAKTLDQELGLAKEIFDALHQQQLQQDIQSKSFSLRPSGVAPLLLDEDEDEDDNDRRIDGDRWTFAGQHYTVDEKKK